VGRALAATLARRLRVAGISRAPPGGSAAAWDEWRRADLFNLREAEAALAGATYAVYLVHGMMPSARLTQGSFADLDLVCADNFARAAKHAGVEQIVYLGGLIPEGGRLSAHLESRLEVEETLAGYGVPVTVLRAGMVIGGGGASFEILERLVKRLPAMICPRWTLTRMQPVAIDDVVSLLAFAVGEPACFRQIFDVGAPEALTYRDLMALTAEVVGVRRPMVPVRVVTPALSRLWVSLVTGAPRALVGPLVESLRHEMVARDHRLADMAGLEPTPVRVALERALAFHSKEQPTRSHAEARRAVVASIRTAPHVRSVQRMRLPPGRDAAWAADEYARWLPSALRGMLRVEVDPDRTCRFYFGSMKRPLLELTYADERSRPDRQLFYVSGGLLARTHAADGGRARFELRQVLDRRTLITAIHDYRPRLPWSVYRATQARFHAAVMSAFGRHLARAPAAQSDGVRDSRSASGR
jgi:uncharacterized protein YbjT (DUF2867 family)